MKKSILCIVTSMMCLLAYSANIPKVNNHGFPQNTKTSERTNLVEQTSNSANQDVEFKAKQASTPKKNVQKQVTPVPSSETTTITNQESSSTTDVQPLSKKEVKKAIKEAKKSAKEDNETMSIIAFILSLIFPILGLIFGYIAKGQDGSNIYNKLAIIFGWIFTGIILFYWLGYVIIISSLLI